MASVRLWCAVLLLSVSFASHSATRACNGSDTLEELAECITKQIPQHGSNGYVVPNATQRDAFGSVVTKMLQGQCDFALPTALTGPMRLRTFTDTSNGRQYCLLMEVADEDNNGFVDRGWGTFITYLDATREISHQAPHPKFDTDTTGSAGDSYTEREAIRIFKQTDARSYLMCGARRSANAANSTCQSDYEVADCAHNVENMFHAANEALNAFYAERNWTALQWHGMARSSCNETMFLSLGFDANPPADSKIMRLRNAIRALRPSWVVNTPDTACSLNATDNPTGRMLNGVPSGQACGTRATTPSHKFLHIEQDVPVIGEDLEGVSNSWSLAVVNALTPPGTPSAFSATSGAGSVNLSWSAAQHASHYVLKRSAVSGGPYSTVAAKLVSTQYTDKGLTAGLSYFYVLLAANSAGESAATVERSATPGAGGGTTLRLRPVADAHVRDGSNAGTNYGSAREMHAKGGGSGGTRHTYLKFDLSQASSVGQATLRLNIKQNNTGGGVALNARWVADTTWSESGVNWNNRPPMGAVLSGVTTNGSTTFAWYEFDVTAYVQAEKARGQQVLSLGVTSGIPGALWAKIRSRDAASNMPELVIAP